MLLEGLEPRRDPHQRHRPAPRVLPEVFDATVRPIDAERRARHSHVDRPRRAVLGAQRVRDRGQHRGRPADADVRSRADRPPRPAGGVDRGVRDDPRPAHRPRCGRRVRHRLRAHPQRLLHRSRRPRVRGVRRPTPTPSPACSTRRAPPRPATRADLRPHGRRVPPVPTADAAHASTRSSSARRPPRPRASTGIWGMDHLMPPLAERAPDVRGDDHHDAARGPRPTRRGGQPRAVRRVPPPGDARPRGRHASTTRPAAASSSASDRARCPTRS